LRRYRFSIFSEICTEVRRSSCFMDPQFEIDIPLGKEFAPVWTVLVLFLNAVVSMFVRAVATSG